MSRADARAMVAVAAPACQEPAAVVSRLRMRPRDAARAARLAELRTIVDASGMPPIEKICAHFRISRSAAKRDRQVVEQERGESKRKSGLPLGHVSPKRIDRQRAIAEMLAAGEVTRRMVAARLGLSYSMAAYELQIALSECSWCGARDPAMTRDEDGDPQCSRCAGAKAKEERR